MKTYHKEEILSVKFTNMTVYLNGIKGYTKIRLSGNQLPTKSIFNMFPE